jgi:riboflavin kinase/FMN adenylyltransferase
VAPERAPGMLQTIEEKVFSLSQFAPDIVLVVPFTWQFAQTPAAQFLSGCLNDRLACRELHVGLDARFGRKREGDVGLLRAASAAGAFDLMVADDVFVGGERVSSSRIRRAIIEGDVVTAADCLGRPWTISGEVVGGARRGRRMGFPTANIASDGELVPTGGVYAALTTIGRTTYPVAVHIGPIPTFGVQSPVVEAHVCGFQGELVGRRLRVHLLCKIRGIRRFDGPDALAAQISTDVSSVTCVVRGLLDNRESIAYKIPRFDPEGGDCW